MNLFLDENSLKGCYSSLDNIRKTLQNSTITVFVDVCKQCTQEIETNIRQGWRDKTGNLYSSIGVALGCNKKIIGFYGFNGMGDKGRQIGKETAIDIGARQEGYFIIAVAGMDYAENMEARGIPVLVTVEEITKEGIKTAFKKIKEEVMSV